MGEKYVNLEVEFVVIHVLVHGRVRYESQNNLQTPLFVQNLRVKLTEAGQSLQFI